MKNIYCTLDTETFGGASNPKGIYHLAGIIHDRQGNILATFNYLIAEHYEEIEKDDYAKKNFFKYLEMIQNGIVTLPKSTHEERIKSNFDIFNFELSSEDMAKIDAMEPYGNTGHHPDDM